MNPYRWPEERKVKEEKRHKCRTVSVSDENYEKIQKLGHGNFSSGVRVLVERFAESEEC
jgi:hypothetical protein